MGHPAAGSDAFTVTLDLDSYVRMYHLDLVTFGVKVCVALAPQLCDDRMLDHTVCH